MAPREKKLWTEYIEKDSEVKKKIKLYYAYKIEIIYWLNMSKEYKW